MDEAEMLRAWGPALLLPLAVIEGPVVTVAAGFLAARGWLDALAALCLVIAGDVIGDVIYHWIGRRGGAPLRAAVRLAGMRDGLPAGLQAQLARNAARMLVIGKWTHSLGFVTLIGSGMVGMPWRRFLPVVALATLPKSAALFAFGWFAGDRWDVLARHGLAVGAGLALAGVAALAIALLLGRWRQEAGR
jgi:membrane protein DedA with SNARE-associated domain